MSTHILLKDNQIFVKGDANLSTDKIGKMFGFMPKMRVETGEILFFQLTFNQIIPFSVGFFLAAWQLCKYQMESGKQQLIIWVPISIGP